MPRLNIYIPDDLDLELRRFPGEINISRVCAAALRARLAASSDDRLTSSLFGSVFANPSWLERMLMERLPLRRAITADRETVDTPQDAVADLTAGFLGATVFEGLTLGVGGGTQMWNVVRRLEPRNVGMNIWALGYGHVDGEAPHVHPNMLVTLLSLLYTPRSRAHLVGAGMLDRAWHLPTLFPKDQKAVKRYLVGSCSMFDPESPYAHLLGKEMTDFLMDEHVMGDFLGVFITPDGRLVEPYAPGMTVSHVPSTDLRELARRDDTIVLLATAGAHKVKLVRAVIDAGLCNCLITDSHTGYLLTGLPTHRDTLDSDDLTEES